MTHTGGGLSSSFLEVGIRGVEADRASLSACVSGFLGSGTTLALGVFLRPVLHAGISSSCFLSGAARSWILGVVLGGAVWGARGLGEKLGI